ncbi:MAG: hypothetical protein MZV65_43750 [Chromatiales bacterium]|nr:hypothetical protein [Chromatiales bacterium]
MVQPLQNGLEAAINMILDNCRLITHTEIFNIHDTIETKENDFILFTKFVKLLNDGNKDSLLDFFSKNKINVNHSGLHKTLEYIKSNKLIPAIGSDATGRSTLAPGMGLLWKTVCLNTSEPILKSDIIICPARFLNLCISLPECQKCRLRERIKPILFV